VSLQWFRWLSSSNRHRIPNAVSSVYMPSGDDIGLRVEAEAVAVSENGDVLARATVREHVIANSEVDAFVQHVVDEGSARFELRLLGAKGYPGGADLQGKVLMAVTPTGVQLTDASHNIDLTLGGPVTVTLSVYNPLAMTIETDSSSTRQLRATLIAASPSERDLIALCLKALIKTATR
jgi:hypothetical protein